MWTKRDRNELTYVFNLYTHRHNTDTHSLPLSPDSSGYSAKYSLALTTAAINSSLVYITMATTRPCTLCVYVCACVQETACGIGGELCRFIWFISVYIIRQPFNWSVITSVCECVSWFRGESVCSICSCCGICIVPQTTTSITWMVRKKRHF